MCLNHCEAVGPIAKMLYDTGMPWEESWASAWSVAEPGEAASALALRKSIEQTVRKTIADRKKGIEHEGWDLDLERKVVKWWSENK